MANLKSIDQYYQRILFPGGIKLYPLGVLDALPSLREVGGKSKGHVYHQTKKIAYESKREQREIYRMMKILEATSIKTQVLKLTTPSGKAFYPDFMVQLGDGSIIIVEVKHLLDFLWRDVIEKYQTMIEYAKRNGYGVVMMDGNWRDFEFVRAGHTIHFPQVITWFETMMTTTGTITMKDLRKVFPEEKYWGTLVGYCLMNNYLASVSFRDGTWAIALNKTKKAC